MTKLVGGLVLSVVLGAAHPAEAACAWVLWSRIAMPTAEQWGAVGAAERQIDCQQSKVAAVAEMVKGLKSRGNVRSVTTSGGSDVRNSTVVMAELPDGRLLSTVYVCLPDTIDPRDPKGQR